VKGEREDKDYSSSQCNSCRGNIYEIRGDFSIVTRKQESF
jgi:hypothetical protein